MQKQEKTFLTLSALFAIFGIIAFSHPLMLKIAHGLTQYFIAGFSNGKLITAIFWLSILPLICFLSLKFALAKKIEKKHKTFLHLFIASSILAFSLGIIQFYYFSNNYFQGTNFATFIQEKNYSNWEASKISHNHFPKITIYFLEKNIGIDSGNNFDDGLPFYKIFPNADAWSLAFTTLILIMIASTILHLISKSNSINAFDFLLFALASLSFTVHSIDGGIGTATIITGLFFFTLYYSRNYLKFSTEFKNLAPIILSVFITVLIAGIVSIDVLNVVFSIPAVISLGLGYYFVKEIQEKKIRKNLIMNLMLGVVFLTALNNALINLNVFIEGKWVLDNSQIPYARTSEKGDGLFIYGIPENANIEEMKKILIEYGSIESFDSKGWVAYARIIPKKPFRVDEVEEKMKSILKPKGYFYIEEVLPSKNITEYKLYLLENKKPIKFDNEFLGLKIIKQEFNPQEKSIRLLIQGSYDNTWQMLAILTEAKNKGLKEQSLLVK